MKSSKSENHLNNIRHSLAHVLAAAVLEQFPGTKLGIGPIIENGFYYDFKFKKPFSADKLPKLEKLMKRIIKQNLPFNGKRVTSLQAIKQFKGERFKLDLIKELVKEKKELSVYYTCPHKPPKPHTLNPKPCFFDLCRGGHVKNTREINIDAFKLTHIAGAYWRGNEKNPMLTRIYAVAFNSKKELDSHLKMLEEAKKRDHRILGEKLKLFTFAKEVGPGLALWLPNGTIIRDEIEKYAKEIEKEWGYERVTTPHIAKEDLFKISGHLPYYKDDMYPPMKLDDGNYYLKAMNCPHTHMIYKAHPKSYRELPVRYAEYGTVYRHELSGTLAGLLRVRGMTMNDAHIYCSEVQVEKEFLNVMKLHEFWYKKVFGIKDFYMRLSLPAKDRKKYAGLPSGWKKSVELVRRAMKKSKLPFIEVEDEAAFYGPKVDFQIKSAIGREESASTNQLDFLATERFDLNFTDKDGKKKPVYVIHRAPLGTHERFVAFLIEHFAGAFPLWLAPIQVRILPVSNKFTSYAKKIKDVFNNENIRVEIDDADETLGKRIRTSEMEKIPYVLVVGEKEQKAKSVNVRHYKKGVLGDFSVSKLVLKLKTEIEKKTI